MPDIYQVLKDLNIDYIKHEHEPLFTCEQAEEFYSHIKGGHSKNLFLRNKNGKKHYLAIVEAHKTVKLQELAKFVEQKKLGFASPERLKKYLSLTPGSVTPFGLIHDTNRDVEVIIDEDLMKYNNLHYHPNTNTATLEVTRDDLKKFLDFTGHMVRYYKF